MPAVPFLACDLACVVCTVQIEVVSTRPTASSAAFNLTNGKANPLQAGQAGKRLRSRDLVVHRVRNRKKAPRFAHCDSSIKTGRTKEDSCILRVLLSIYASRELLGSIRVGERRRRGDINRVVTRRPKAGFGPRPGTSRAVDLTAKFHTGTVWQ